MKPAKQRNGPFSARLNVRLPVATRAAIQEAARKDASTAREWSRQALRAALRPRRKLLLSRLPSSGLDSSESETPVFGLVVPVSLARRVRSAAGKERGALSAWIRNALEQALREDL